MLTHGTVTAVDSVRNGWNKFRF